jgi:deoxyribodipyrimidine photo-lyase
MQAGTTWINSIRIYNPIKNGLEKDSFWKHIYKYLPELKNVPIKYIHEPWKYEYFSTIKYPEPIIDVESANRNARDILWTLKWKTSKKTKDAIMNKHGSRSFQWKNKKTASKKDTAQIALF